MIIFYFTVGESGSQLVFRVTRTDRIYGTNIKRLNIIDGKEIRNLWKKRFSIGVRIYDNIQDGCFTDSSGLNFKRLTVIIGVGDL